MQELRTIDPETEFFSLVQATSGANAPHVLEMLENISPEEADNFRQLLARREYLRSVIAQRATDQFVTYKKIS